MAIDTTTITRLISSFRKLAVKDSATPESVGYLLQRLADLIATAERSGDMNKYISLLESYANAGNALLSIEQGSSDRNNILASIRSLKLDDGGITTAKDAVFIRQATTERAGAMRAQHVQELNTTYNKVAALEKDMVTAKSDLAKISEKVNGIPTSGQFSCIVYDGKLHITGAQTYLNAGYVPYIFRKVRKRHPFKDKNASEEDRKSKKYGPVTKGWGVFGSMHAVKISGTTVQFSSSNHSYLSRKEHEYSENPEVYVSRNLRKDGDITFGWGRSSVNLTDENIKGSKKQRMIRLRFGIGFAKPMYPGRAKITPSNLVSPLAEFFIVYDPNTKKWIFST